MKKLSIFLVFILITAAFVGCSNTETPADTEEPQEQEEAMEEEQEQEEQEETDAVSTASIVDNEADFKKSISKDGNWITATTADLSFDEELVLEGTFEKEGEVVRKIGLYTSNEDHSIDQNFTLTTPKLTVKSKNALLKAGTFDTDLYIDAENVTIEKTTVTGDVYFTKEAYKESFTVKESEINGEQIVQTETDAVSTASIVDNEADFKKSISKDGNWITATTADLSFDEELVLEGTFEKEGEVVRKIGLYTSNEDHSIDQNFTLTTPKLTVKSKNALLKAGTFDTDLYIDAENVTIEKTTVTGDVYFTKEAYKESFTVKESEVNGEMKIVE